MKHLFTRVLAIVLCLCLMPLAALAEYYDLEYPVTRSTFDFAPRLNADAFPNDGAAHYEDWEAFLSKLSVSGTADVQLFLQPTGRTYADAALCLNGEPVIPFEYDNYYSDFRYLRSPALGGASVFFHFRNFYEFMFKGYYYMGLPTHLIAVPLYPQSVYEFVEKYASLFAETFAGEGARKVSYDTLYDLCQRMNLIMTEDMYDAAYYILTALLIDIGADSFMWDKLAYTENWLDYLDPDRKGLTITCEGDRENWVLGETTVFSRDESSITVYLPDADGYVFSLSCHDFVEALFMQFQVSLEGEERFGLVVKVDGLQDADNAQGNVHIELTGGAFYEEIAPIDFQYSFHRTGSVVPYDLALSVDWVHPETGLPAIGATFTTSLTDQAHEALRERPYDDQEDLFHMNESLMASCKERFIPTLALAAMPIVLEMPSGIISDIFGFLDETGILAVLGLE